MSRYFWGRKCLRVIGLLACLDMGFSHSEDDCVCMLIHAYLSGKQEVARCQDIGEKNSKNLKMESRIHTYGTKLTCYARAVDLTVGLLQALHIFFLHVALSS